MVRLVTDPVWKFRTIDHIPFSVEIIKREDDEFVRYLISGQLKPDFGTDLQSIPFFLGPLLDKYQHETADESAVHDALCRSQLLPRHLCDKVFYELLKDSNFHLAKLYYTGVRIGSASPFYKPTLKKMVYARQYVDVEIIEIERFNA